ncbi:Similar to TTC12: Tetratricopeptide repeat protein 12 (Fragment) (Macaca fascicularis) [Cotesia congregata]|uniref:Similar to TTC12: Tetratricopeptide repeat protein 12 (Macaca fascicularis) n=1 Tax=Cotesia congregata TaxID=51543 RepID=A0A8J2MRT9_COTCN
MEFAVEEKRKAVENLPADRNVTEEEFCNFMQRVTEVENIVKKLSSADVKEQEEAKVLADLILEGKKDFKCDPDVRNERADTFKRIGNGAFGVGDFAKAVTYYGKALEQRKDSAVIWNNRALSYMRLGLYEKALQDCEWALKVNDSNIKALLNSAKCYAYLGNEEKRDEFIRLAKERVPKFSKYIQDFEETLKANPNDSEEIII